MNRYERMISGLNEETARAQLRRLYGNREGQLEQQCSRYTSVLTRHEKAFHTEGPLYLISAPGRTEIGGNHTDHNRGRVLAASVNLDCLAAVSPRDDMEVHLHSEGYRPLTVDLNDLSVRPKENGTTIALIRGVAARMKELGYRIGGFDAAATSTVASGSGLSSSAAFEVMMVAVFDQLYNGNVIDFVTRAKIGQYAEREYFGKPCGLLDQMASSAGGLVAVDFCDEEPQVSRLAYDFSKKGYALVVVATGGSHANLTDDYAAIPAEMKQVAACFGQDCLRRVSPEDFSKALPTLYGKVPDRAILRAMHFYTENTRVRRQVEALQQDNLPAFLREIIASGRSSYMYLQNVYAHVEDQSLSIALALAEQLLQNDGAWRIHGGGFAGTTLNFVPQEKLRPFTACMEGLFGQHCCHVLDIRPEGAYTLQLDEN